MTRVGTGAQIGGCELERLIGTGGMGLVYEAMQIHPRRRVAVKVLRGDKLERGRLRFEEEIQLLTRRTRPTRAPGQRWRASRTRS